MAMSLETPTKIRMLQRNKLYLKAKEEPTYRFYLLYDKIYREDILAFAHELAKSNKGVPGVDRQSFAEIESQGVQEWLISIKCEGKILRAQLQEPTGVGIEKAIIFGKPHVPVCEGKAEWLRYSTILGIAGYEMVASSAPVRKPMCQASYDFTRWLVVPLAHRALASDPSFRGWRCH